MSAAPVSYVNKGLTQAGIVEKLDSKLERVLEMSWKEQGI